MGLMGTISITTLNITTTIKELRNVTLSVALSITAFRIVTIGITTLSIRINDTQHRGPNITT
jgi:hypothetical protein